MSIQPQNQRPLLALDILKEMNRSPHLKHAVIKSANPLAICDGLNIRETFPLIVNPIKSEEILSPVKPSLFNCFTACMRKSQNTNP